jgi:hypothetical protein
MHEVVRSTLPDNPFRTLSLPSLAGTGLTERLRSTTFAVLGLTAAAGLGLVAIFAQPGWPLLSQAPIPASPQTKVVGAVAVDHGPRGFAPAGVSTAGPARASNAGGRPTGTGKHVGVHRHGSEGSVHSPVPVTAPPASGGDNSEAAGAPSATPVSAPAPSQEPATAPAPETAPVASPSNGSSETSSSPGRSKAAAPPSAGDSPGKSASAPGHTAPARGSSTSHGSSHVHATPSSAPPGTSTSRAPGPPPADSQGGGPPSEPPGQGNGKSAK